MLGDNRIDQRVITRHRSRYMCEAHNLRVGGTRGSYHTKGRAADLSCSLGAKALFLTIANLKAKGKLPDLEYTIWYDRKDFVHIDCGDKRNNFFEARA